MADDPQRRAHTIFKRVIDVEPHKRPEALRAECGDDDSLRRRVSALLAALEDTQGFLETPALQAPAWARTDTAEAVERVINTEIDGYQIESIIGAGGMATVYKALQERPRRHVALKVMKRGLVGTSALHRFQFETEVLGRLRHPGIAQIYESGSFEDGGIGSVPYFAMEFIEDALPLTIYAMEAGLTRRRRLAMFADVCDAVHHGHANGVIHRDLKPANILVDPAGSAKVIDFGIARSSDDERDLITQHTSEGQLIGTLNYMSPEQCTIAPANLDLRTDVYSLGVMLYELMCGCLPHDLSNVPVPEAMRKIQQDAPTRPSTINAALRGDLDAIILKAIDKDPERRYMSAAELGKDIRHHLHHETIEARPPTAFYQLKRFAQRNRALVAASLIVIVTLVITATISTRSALDANREALQRAAAETEAVHERDIARWQAYIATVAAAQGAYNAGEFHRMRTRLNLAPDEHRAWEWNFLNGLANPSIDTIKTNQGLIMSMAADPSVSQIFTGGADGSIRIWDVATQVFTDLESLHPDRVRCLSLSPDGSRLASGAHDGTARIWDVETGFVLHELEGHRAEVQGIVFTADNRVISASPDQVLIWDASTGTRIGEIEDHPPEMFGTTLDHDRRRLALFGETGEIVVHDLTGEEAVRRFKNGSANYSVAFSDNGRWMAAGGIQGQIRIWRLDRNELVREFTSSTTVVRTLTFTHGGQVLAAGHGREISLWSMSNGEQLASLFGHADGLAGVIFSPDDEMMYSASWDRTIRTWDMEEPDPVVALRGHEDNVVAMAISHDGSMVASGSSDHTVRLWDTVLGTELAVLRGHTDRVYATTFAPDGRHLYTAAYDSLVRIWDIVTGEEVGQLEGMSGGIWQIRFSPDGQRVACSGDDPAIRVYDVETRQVISELRGHAERVDGIAYGPNGVYLASGSRDHSVRLWHIEEQREVRSYPGHVSDVFSVIFAPDGDHIISGSRDQTVRMWDIQTGECVKTLSEHGQFITCLSLSPDGTRLAAASWWREILLWDLATGDEVLNFSAHDDAIRSIAFSPDGRRIVSSSYDSTVKIWDSATRSERRRERDEARRLMADAARIVDELVAINADPRALADAVAEDPRLTGPLRPWANKVVLMRCLGTDLDVITP